MPDFTPTLKSDFEPQFAAIRNPRKLTLISSELEGAPIGSLPDNIYGY